MSGSPLVGPVERILPREFATPPTFAIPLSVDELRELGTFVAIWSQIDFLAAGLIALLTNTSMAACILFLESSTSGPRLNILKKSALRPQKTPVKDSIVELCENNSGLLEDRNHIIHGLWAINWDLKTDIVSAGCLFQKGFKPPMPVTKLRILSDRAAKLSNGLGKALRELQRVDDKLAPAPLPYFFGDGEPELGRMPPQWPPKSPE
jgi:hypothetical protein